MTNPLAEETVERILEKSGYFREARKARRRAKHVRGIFDELAKVKKVKPK
jgi:hypothetical protein